MLTRSGITRLVDGLVGGGLVRARLLPERRPRLLRAADRAGLREAARRRAAPTWPASAGCSSSTSARGDRASSPRCSAACPAPSAAAPARSRLRRPACAGPALRSRRLEPLATAGERTSRRYLTAQHLRYISCSSINLLTGAPMSATTLSADPRRHLHRRPGHSNVGFEVRHMGIATVRGAFRRVRGHDRRDRRRAGPGGHRRGRQHRHRRRQQRDGHLEVARVLRRRAAPADHLPLHRHRGGSTAARSA